MTTYVLVHGGWTGSYAFRHVRRLLQAEGHEVFTPSLTGIGERSHLSSPQVSLSTHVHDVVNVVLYEDLHDIVLLGFSYGGAVVSGAVAHIVERVRHLVFVDAFVLDDGDSVFSLAGVTEVPSIALEETWLVPPVPREFEDADEAAFVNARRTPHPIRCFTEAVRMPKPVEAYPFTRTFIRASQEKPETPGTDSLAKAAERARAAAEWQYHEIASNHMIPTNHPKELVEILLALG
jgi:pimeloyl-ACP methyl ester carboxylesterase